ncbi:hypothetical protein KIN20_014034 [Parelaphostrongylus tenuis]|uniref:Uncharacterized protein n=1 Tax=Parelaphostrongylus tenuis TaxID=148309 RepID=A0AAD5QN25_PARTN|nr:hypothetical protein KIN20_014024 [Parelaphostrongylus tenuis]KAJ1356337.1 hypothetical protein KIN20_014034 [Parelaphostrongylus tenuis]
MQFYVRDSNEYVNSFKKSADGRPRNSWHKGRTNKQSHPISLSRIRIVAEDDAVRTAVNFFAPSSGNYYQLHGLCVFDAISDIQDTTVESCSARILITVALRSISFLLKLKQDIDCTLSI